MDNVPGQEMKGRPRNSFVLVVANICYQVQDQVAKLIFVVAKLYVHFFTQ